MKKRHADIEPGMGNSFIFRKKINKPVVFRRRCPVILIGKTVIRIIYLNIRIDQDIGLTRQNASRYQKHTQHQGHP
jgi:hypothetical protein